MSGVAGLGVDERRARVVLSLLAEPDDPVTGALLRRLGAVETLGLLDTNTTVPGLGRVDGQVWRDCLTSPDRLDGLDQRLRMVEESGITTLIPGDAQWPRALDDLGDRAPYVLFVRGTTSFLARPLNDLVTVTGSRAASAYGEHVADELAGDLANCEHVLVAGGAYGVEAAVHRAVLAAGGDTIVVLAGGVDRPYPSGNRDLLDRVGDVGALVSELPPESVPTRHRFLARSRLLGAMSAATVVVEAGARSGGTTCGGRGPSARTAGGGCAGAGHQRHQSWSARAAPCRPRTGGHLRCRRRRTHQGPRHPSCGAVGRVHTPRGSGGWSAGAISVARSADCGVSHHPFGRCETPLLCALPLQVEVPRRLVGGAPTLVLDGWAGQRS